MKNPLCESHNKDSLREGHNKHSSSNNEDYLCKGREKNNIILVKTIALSTSNAKEASRWFGVIVVAGLWVVSPLPPLRRGTRWL